MKVGDTILMVTSLDGSDSIREYVISKVGKNTIQCGSSEMTFYKASCWPLSVKAELETILAERRRLKIQFDDSMKLVYELKNAISRGEK